MNCPVANPCMTYLYTGSCNRSNPCKDSPYYKAKKVEETRDNMKPKSSDEIKSLTVEER